jgi:hypothetical protein
MAAATGGGGLVENAGRGRELENAEVENNFYPGQSYQPQQQSQQPQQQQQQGRSRGASYQYEPDNQLAEAYDLQHHLGSEGDDYGYNAGNNGVIDAQEDFEDRQPQGNVYDQAYFQQFYERNALNNGNPTGNIGGDHYYDAYPPGGPQAGQDYLHSDNHTARTSNTSAATNDDSHTSASGQQANLEVAFEELIQGREQEFMSQLLAPLADNIPSNIFMFADGSLREQLHDTVNMMLQDKEVHDLESLDSALLEILQLDELRLDMEGMRDDIVQQLLASM